MEKKALWQIRKIALSNIIQVLEAAPYKASTVRPLTIHNENYPS